ncbi:anti-repressor protein [Herbinix hemicellulosilytica]|uniref:AntA/AntB antirepressor domain-containing protein n=1 Tax=Herbinix hemicellulosilytica TaxID=1564487 RepID=A0A0H5SWB4_HERHM|nr:antA/AntB antirepressor family protein [Herbinix hemicellulosilytica]RBP60923.1 anti-repressor protein [Herbinix hemicellulosilytica]CRZ34618.1 hypothetical protein HHT355_1417 [Herbinix hemicellulosilytica]
MNELQVKTELTPIEIALGIDEQGRTTARKLYEFLGLAKSQFSRWCRTNILDNEFAEEGIDYEGFDINVEGNIVKDYRLSASFAKKLSMTAKNERGEQAREYFVRAEEKLKGFAIQISKLPPEMQMFKALFDQQAKQYLELQQLKEDNQKLKEDNQKIAEKIESIRDVISLDTTSWRDDTSAILKRIGMKYGGGEAYSQARVESYELLNKRMGVDLHTRLNNKKKRMAEMGIPKSKIDKLTYVDIIAEDKKLIEGYTAIVKEMAIKYGVT